jgi:peptidoglycan/LPS O-acetylase OafA/YrhL
MKGPASLALRPGYQGLERGAELAADRGFHVASLDGIRGLAALIVFVGHAGLGHIVPGGFGVTVFFFLSGYLITTLLRREYEQTGAICLKKFYLRRVYRIFPPLYLVLAVLILLTLAGAVRNDMTLAGVLAQLAHLTNYYVVASDTPEITGIVPYTLPFWSLAVEEHFYLLFPLALLVLLRRQPYRRIALVLALACGLVLLWRCVLVLALDNPGHYTYHASDTRLDSLLFGCIMALYRNPALDPPSPRLAPRAWAAICALAVALLVFTFLYRSPAFRDTLRYTAQGIALFPLFYCAVRYHHWPVFSWLSSKPLVALGLISYTFYLAHFAGIQLAMKLVGSRGVLGALAGFCLTTAFAAACYLLVERRFAALRRRLHG